MYERFRRWTQEGLLDRILQRLQSEADAVDEIDWRLLKESRRIATRFEKQALHYWGVIKLGMILEYL